MIYLVKFTVENFVNENGKEVNKKVQIIIDSDTYQDVEQKVHCYSEKEFGLPCKIKDIKQTNIANIQFDEYVLESNKTYFIYKIAFLTVDERTGKEKYSFEVNVMVTNNIDECKDLINKEMESAVIPWSIKELKETKISDYIKF